MNGSGKPDIPTRLEELDHLLTVKGLATTLSISPSNLYELCKSKRIPHLIVGGAIRFDPVITAHWLRNSLV